MATSNSIQTLRLPYTYNVASKTLGVIFVSTHLKGRIGTRKWKVYDPENDEEIVEAGEVGNIYCNQKGEREEWGKILWERMKME